MVSIFFKNLFLLKGGEWQALQCFTSPDSYTCKERSCFFLFSFLRSCDPDSDMLRRTLSSPTSPGGHPPCLLSRGREGEERRGGPERILGHKRRLLLRRRKENRITRNQKKRTKQNKTKKNKPTSQEERGRRRKHRGERSYDLTQSVPCSPGDFLIHSGLVMMILKNNMW